MLSVLKEYQIIVKFLFKFDNSATEALHLLREVYGNGCLSGLSFFMMTEKTSKMIFSPIALPRQQRIKILKKKIVI